MLSPIMKGICALKSASRTRVSLVCFQRSVLSLMSSEEAPAEEVAPAEAEVEEPEPEPAPAEEAPKEEGDEEAEEEPEPEPEEEVEELPVGNPLC